MQIDGVFGGAIFKHFLVTINYRKREFTIQKKIEHKTDLGKEVPIELNQGRPVVYSEITLSNNKKVKGRFTLDTGARSTVFHQTFFERSNVNNLKDTLKILGSVGYEGNVFG